MGVECEVRRGGECTIVKKLTYIFLSSSKCVLYIEGSPTRVFSISTNLDTNPTVNHSHHTPITRHTLTCSSLPLPSHYQHARDLEKNTRISTSSCYNCKGEIKFSLLNIIPRTNPFSDRK